MIQQEKEIAGRYSETSHMQAPRGHLFAHKESQQLSSPKHHNLASEELKEKHSEGSLSQSCQMEPVANHE